MAEDSSTQSAHGGGTTTDQKGFGALTQHCMDNKLQVALWATRLFTIVFTFLYFIPIFGNPYSAYYKALFANGATSAIRLHMRIPNVSFTRGFLASLLLEDSCHYLFYSIIFLFVSPITFALLPIFLFSLIHFSSYSLTLLDCLGQNSWWCARLMISLVEFQSRNILRLIAFTEIILMPFVVILIFIGRAGLFIPFMYYHFLSYRYNSRRNPYTKNMFHELRVIFESIAAKQGMPPFISSLIHMFINFVCRLQPQVQQQTAQ